MLTLGDAAGGGGLGSPSRSPNRSPTHRRLLLGSNSLKTFDADSGEAGSFRSRPAVVDAPDEPLPL